MLDRKGKTTYLLLALASCALGLCMILWPAKSLQSLCTVVGALLVIFGGVKVIGYFFRKEMGFRLDFAFGVLCVLAGVTVMAFARVILASLPVLLGVILLMDGIFKLQGALDLRRMGAVYWWATAVVAGLCILLGAFLAFRPFDSLNVGMVILGAALLLDSIQNLILFFRGSRRPPKPGDIIDV